SYDVIWMLVRFGSSMTSLILPKVRISRIFIPSLVAESGNVDHGAGPAPPWFERRIRRRARRRAGPPAAFAVVLLQEIVLRITRNSVPQRRASASRSVPAARARRARP